MEIEITSDKCISWEKSYLRLYFMGMGKDIVKNIPGTIKAWTEIAQ